MTFWKALRWIGSIMFIALFIAAWMASTPTSSNTDQVLPSAPVIVR